MRGVWMRIRTVRGAIEAAITIAIVLALILVFFVIRTGAEHGRSGQRSVTIGSVATRAPAPTATPALTVTPL